MFINSNLDLPPAATLISAAQPPAPHKTKAARAWCGAKPDSAVSLLATVTVACVSLVAVCASFAQAFA